MNLLHCSHVLIQTNLHLAKKLEMSFDHDSEDELDEREGSDTDDDDDDDDAGSPPQERELREGGRRSFSLSPQKRATKKPTPFKTTTPAALSLARIDVNAVLADGDNNSSSNDGSGNSSSSGLLRISAVGTMMTRALLAVGVGGEHPCAGQAVLLQLVRRRSSGNSSSFWEHGGDSSGGSGDGSVNAAVMEPECKEVEAVLEGTGTNASSPGSNSANIRSSDSGVASLGSSSNSGGGETKAPEKALEDSSKATVSNEKEDEEEDEEDRDSLDELDAEINAARQAASLDAQIASPVSDTAVLAAAEAADGGATGTATTGGTNGGKSNPAPPAGSKSTSAAASLQFRASGLATGGSGSRSLASEDATGSHLWAWRKVYSIDAGHAAAPRCLALAETSTTGNSSSSSSDNDRDSSGSSSSSTSKGGSVVVAVADGVGAVSVTHTGSGRTNVSPAGPGRGGIVQLMSRGRSNSGENLDLSLKQ